MAFTHKVNITLFCIKSVNTYNILNKIKYIASQEPTIKKYIKKYVSK